MKLHVTASRISAAARKIIEDAGGTVNETGTRRDHVRGIDRTSDDKRPKNLTKKLKRSSGPKKVVIEEIDEDTKDKKPKKEAPAGEGKPQGKPAGASPRPSRKPSPSPRKLPRAAQEDESVRTYPPVFDPWVPSVPDSIFPDSLPADPNECCKPF